MNEHQPTHAVAQSQTGPRTRSRAEAKIIVQHSEAKPYDQTVSPALMEIRINETFTGDIDGQSMVRALQVLRDDQSASFASMQRVRGKLGGRHSWPL
jgi:GTP-dependent phosphoenolpyruvate carboxykinase